MTAIERTRGLSPEARTTVYFTTLFMAGGPIAAYAGIWMTSKGLTSGQIGIINAAPVLVMLLLNVAVGRLADRASDWRQVIVVASLAAAVLPIGLFFVEDFLGILLVWTLAIVAGFAIGPVADAAAMRMSLRRGGDLGVFRAWATLGFMAMLIATGIVTGWYGPAAFLPLFVGLSLLRGVTSLQLPNFRATPEQRAARGGDARGATSLSSVMRLWFLLPLIGWSMVFATHMWLHAFQALLWSRQGLSEPLIGGLIAIGALSEAAMFFAFRRFGRRYPARWLALASGVVAAARWTAMSFSPGVELLIPLQLLHSITYALGFMGCVQFIANWTSEDIAAEAQGFFVMLQQGIGVAVILGGGMMVEVWGAGTYLAAALVASAGAVLIWLSLRLQQPKG